MEMPSVTRHRAEEETLNEYLFRNDIVCKDNKRSTETELFQDNSGTSAFLDDETSAFEKRERHKVYRKIGFGYLAHFRTMRFLIFILVPFTLIMITAGYSNARTSVAFGAGITLLD